MNLVFALLVILGLLTGIFTGDLKVINEEILLSAQAAVERIMSLMGVFTLWLGIAKVAEKSGLLAAFTKYMSPLVKILFPSIPKGHPAMGAILMNMSANLFGFGSAATPFGLKAMEELQKLNPDRENASEAMCTFLAINTSSITLIPTTIIALRVNAGSTNPFEIIGTIFFATTVSTICAISADYIFRSLSRRRK